MTDNPFEATEAHTPFDGRSVDLGTVFTEGTSMAVRHVLQFLLAGFVLFAAYLVSICTCVGWIITLPYMVWGTYAFLLTVADGEARIDALWSGLEDPGRVFLSGWGLIFCLVVIVSPTIGTAVATEFAVQEGMLPAWSSSVVPLVAGAAWGALIAPLTYAPLLWADGRAGVIASFTMAIDAFKGSWLQVALISVVLQLGMAPSSLASAWLQSKQLEMLTAGPDEIWSVLAPLLSVVAFIYLVMFVMGVLGQCWMANAYRQVVPRAQ